MLWIRTIVMGIVLTSGLAQVGCSGEPLPKALSEYAGRWEGLGVDLTITPDGGVSYHKVSGSGKTEINAPIQSYENGDLIVGIMGITTTFDVQEPPREVDGKWTMTVDGIKLTRYRLGRIINPRPAVNSTGVVVAR